MIMMIRICERSSISFVTESNSVINLVEKNSDEMVESEAAGGTNHLSLPKTPSGKMGKKESYKGEARKRRESAKCGGT